MDYQDFTIDIRSAQDGKFEATVVEAPLGTCPRITFERPFDPLELAALLNACDRQAHKGVVDQGPKPRDVGERLYSTVFQKEIADLLLACRAALPRDGDSGLRLRFRFLLSDKEAEYLGALPWEWMWDPRTSSFLATELSTPIVRDFAAPSRGFLEISPPLRILVVDAAPGTMRELELKLEIERMRAALDPLIQAGEVELLHLDVPTPEALRDKLRAEKIHVLHFMGHGGYHTVSGYGALFFVKPDGSQDQVDGEELADYLKTIPSLRLVVLNACKTARHASRAGAPLYYGVASAILERAGVPAVVANQHTISDEAAIAFSEIFYGQLAKGYDVDAALTEARLRLKRISREWGTPVLYLTGKGGRIFAVKPARNGQNRTVLPAETAAEPVRLGIRSFVGWGRDMKDRNHQLLDLVEYFDGRFLRPPADWQETIFPKLRTFLLDHIDPLRPVQLDLAAHASIAFAAGWVLEAKSGLDVRVRQRTSETGELEWHPDDGSAGEERLWHERQDLIRDLPGGPDVALSLAVSQPGVAQHVEDFIRRKNLPVGRILDAVIEPEPGPRSVRGGGHALRLAQTLLPRLRQKHPDERTGKLHLFCAAPNALLFYLGQLARSLGTVVLYEFAFEMPDSFGRYQPSIELPPPAERPVIPEGW